MNKDEVFGFIKNHPIFQLGTIDGNKPRVRTISLFRADENGVMFYTHTAKDLHKQLMVNLQVELCFASIQPAAEIRISGSVELVKDEALQKQIDPASPDTVVIYNLKNGKATMWTKDAALEQKTYVDL
ncbi:MAG: pyridoxamine 5'-phosphate oxidase family protein [Chloroflexi bacterium]|nr:pyridoxamine 5'-phosphate oxidase family protein [Chloroflexota bacterium]